jgi:predicted nucleic acid-binding protein
MPKVVIDTSVALPATLSPRGAKRRFWVLLALGALTYEVEHGRLELEALQDEADRLGGAVGGIEKARARIENASDRRAALLERLPYGVPEDWVAVGSRATFDEYERKLPVVGTRLGLDLSEKDVGRLRRQLEAVCVVAAPPFEEADVPALTHDPKDDPILYTALLADADLLIASDKHLVPDKHEELWEHDGHTVLALTFETLLADRLDEVDWDQIDGSWLALAYDEPD